jgi:hypothetical protein
VSRIWDHIEKINDSKDWVIMIHMYVDLEALLDKCGISNVHLNEAGLRDFMRGFTLSLVGPIFNVVDVGPSCENTSRKIERMSTFLYGLSHDC